MESNDKLISENVQYLLRPISLVTDLLRNANSNGTLGCLGVIDCVSTITYF